MAEGRRDLLDVVQGLIARTYDLDAGVDAAPFVIGDTGLAALYDVAEPDRRPMLLVRTCDGAHRLRVYFPDGLIENLEAHDPRRGLSDANLVDFAAFVEEIDHFHLLVACIRADRPVAALELELHANVTKSLVAALFLARTLGVPRLDGERRALLRGEILQRGDFLGEPPELRARYRDARDHALRFLARLDKTQAAHRPRLLREFSRAPMQRKLALCA